MACDLKQSLQRLLITLRAKILLKALLISSYGIFVLFIPMSQYFGIYACYLWLIPILYAYYQAYNCQNMDLIVRLDQSLKLAGQLEMAYELCMSPSKQMTSSPLKSLFHQHILTSTQDHINGYYLSQHQLDLSQAFSLASIHQLYYPLIKLHFDQDPSKPKRWMIDLLPLALILSFYQAFQAFEKVQQFEQIPKQSQKANVPISEKKLKKLKAFSHKTADEALQKKSQKQVLMTEAEFNHRLKNQENQKINQPEIKGNQAELNQSTIAKAQEKQEKQEKQSTALKINAGQQKDKLKQEWEKQEINSLKKKNKSNIKPEQLPFAKAGLLETTAQEQAKQWQKKLSYYPLYQQKMIKKYLISSQSKINELQDQSQGAPK